MSGCDWYANDPNTAATPSAADCGKPASHIRAGLMLCDTHVHEWDAREMFTGALRRGIDRLERQQTRGPLEIFAQGPELSTSVGTAGVHLTAEMMAEALSHRPPPIKPVATHRQAVEMRAAAKAVGFQMKTLPYEALEMPAPFGCKCGECVPVPKESPHHPECGRLWSEHTITPGGMVCP